MSFITINDLPYILSKGFIEGLSWLAPFGCSNNVDVEPLLIKCAKAPQCPKETKDLKDPKCSQCPQCWFLSCVDKPINVRYLPYQPGHITSVELPAGNLVISGKFSGCWMGLSIDGTGIRTVYHVGIGDGAGNKCKKEFLAIKGDSCYFLPSRIIKSIDDIPKFQRILSLYGYKTDLLSDVYGIITCNNEYYSVIMGYVNTEYRVAAWNKWEVTDKKQNVIQSAAANIVFYDYICIDQQTLK